MRYQVSVMASPEPTTGDEQHHSLRIVPVHPLHHHRGGADMKKAQALQACLVNILDGWGTFLTKIYAALSL